MGAANAPIDESTKRKILSEYQKGVKPKELSEKSGISINTIKAWIARDKSKKSKDAEDAPPSKKDAPPKKKRGAPLGNKNGVGAGPPLGSKNAEKHGGYSAVYWDFLSEEEKVMIDSTPLDEEDLLIRQIQLYEVRERRIMQAINQYREKKGGQYVSGIHSFEKKRKFKSAEEEELYDKEVEKKVKEGKRLPGNSQDIATNTNATIDVIVRLEMELTRAQRAKNNAIDSLIRLRAERTKAEEAGAGTKIVDDWISCLLEDGAEVSEDGAP